MMSYDKYERGRQHLNCGHQRITYKKLTLRLAQSNQWVGVDHADRIHSLNSPSTTSNAEKNKMIVMMTMIINDNDKRKMILDMYEQYEYKM